MNDTFSKWSDIWYSEYHVPDDVKLSLKAEVLYSEDTPFQKLMMLKNDTFGVFMTLDGYVQVTAKDEFVYHEMIAHVPLAVNPDIKKVLIIGGGDGGTAREVARYQSIETIDMIEIDESVVRACQKYLPQTAGVLEADPRISVKFEDGLAFVRNAPDQSYDLILVDSTDPDGPGGVLFTTEFYADCHRVLTEKGILINQHECAFYDGDRAIMQNAHDKIKDIFKIAKVYGFNIPTYSTGYWYFGFASKALDPVADAKSEAWNDLGLSTKYYNSEIHKAAFALPNYVKELLGIA